MFRQTGVNPLTVSTGDHTYINTAGQIDRLPDPKALENAVDAQFLAWPPGDFDSSPDNVNNPSQNPSSYTFQSYPYGWSGFASVGWFHGLTTLNNNVHATNSDPNFTNHEVIPIEEIKSQPSRAKALAKLPQIFVPPETYPGNVPVPLSPDPPVLPVPTDITSQQTVRLAYAIDNAGGYKVQNLIGLYLSAPYLHDGGVAASSEALQPSDKGYYTVADPNQMGMAGTLMQQILPDPEASLRVLVDRDLRAVAVAADWANPDLRATHVDGSGYEYWVDRQAGFTPQEQTNLIQFLLSIDDNPAILASPNRK